MTAYTLMQINNSWLCRIEIDGVEQYRGGFEPDFHTAMERALEWESKRMTATEVFENWRTSEALLAERNRRRADALDAFGDMLQGKILKCNCGLCEQCVYPSEAP